MITTSSTATVTASQDTDVFTTTLTQTSTSTLDVTTTASSTITQTVTATTTATVTYSTSANFVPIASSPAYIAAAAGASRREVPLAFTPNRPVVARNAAPLCSVGANTKNPKNAPKLYPASVNCLVIKQVVNIIKSTVTKTKTVAAPTSTVLQTSTVATTSTVLQNPASSTITETVSTTAVLTNTVSVTTTATETSSTLVAAATPSAYFPQCQSNNIVSRAGAKSFVSFYGFTTISSGTATTAEVCCQNCALNSACSAFAFFPGGQCYLVTAGADCSANPPPFVVSSQAINNGANGYVTGNGNCGQVKVTGVL